MELFFTRRNPRYILCLCAPSLQMENLSGNPVKNIGMSYNQNCLAILVHDAGNIGECIDECVRTANEMAKENANVFVPQQFENPANPRVHRNHTGLEIMEQVAGEIHGFCSGIGTGGTISGIGEVLKRQYPEIEIWAVEPENAAILAGGTVGTHLQMGIGDGLISGKKW